MPLIQCKLGPTTQSAVGVDYSFQRDEYGRYVARVDNLKARAIFLSVEHFVEVPEHPEPEAAPKRARSKPDPVVTGAATTGLAGASTSENGTNHSTDAGATSSDTGAQGGEGAEEGAGAEGGEGGGDATAGESGEGAGSGDAGGAPPATPAADKPKRARKKT